MKQFSILVIFSIFTAFCYMVCEMRWQYYDHRKSDDKTERNRNLKIISVSTIFLIAALVCLGVIYLKIFAGRIFSGNEEFILLILSVVMFIKFFPDYYLHIKDKKNSHDLKEVLVIAFTYLLFNVLAAAFIFFFFTSLGWRGTAVPSVFSISEWFAIIRTNCFLDGVSSGVCLFMAGMSLGTLKEYKEIEKNTKNEIEIPEVL